eukprot:m.118493 g.118493  ORF g.118493 m.118493 type:complete len:55 (+) comp28670_c0_seq2:3335-3499(+)
MHCMLFRLDTLYLKKLKPAFSTSVFPQNKISSFFDCLNLGISAKEEQLQSNTNV